ncbi:hypothetical protein FKW54_08840, partial [Acetobacter pomorum]
LSHPQMVRLSTNASGQCYPRSLTTQNATVVLILKQPVPQSHPFSLEVIRACLVMSPRLG